MQRLSVITASRYRVSVCKRFITRKCAAAALMPELPFTTLCNRRSTWQSFASTPLLKLTSVKDNYGLTTFSFSFQCRPF